MMTAMEEAFAWAEVMKCLRETPTVTMEEFKQMCEESDEEPVLVNYEV